MFVIRVRVRNRAEDFYLTSVIKDVDGWTRVLGTIDEAMKFATAGAAWDWLGDIPKKSAILPELDLNVVEVEEVRTWRVKGSAPCTPSNGR